MFVSRRHYHEFELFAQVCWKNCVNKYTIQREMRFSRNKIDKLKNKEEEKVELDL